MDEAIIAALNLKKKPIEKEKETTADEHFCLSLVPYLQDMWKKNNLLAKSQILNLLVQLVDEE